MYVWARVRSSEHVHDRPSLVYRLDNGILTARQIGARKTKSCARRKKLHEIINVQSERHTEYSKPKSIDASKIIVVRSTGAGAVTRSAVRDSLQSTVEPAPSLKRELDDSPDLLSAPSSKRPKIGAPELDFSVSSPSRRANIFASSSQPTSRLFTKHTRFWALDGNAILQFGSVALRAHQSRLSSQGRGEPLLEADEENINDVVVEELGGLDIFRLDLIGSVEDFVALFTAMEDTIAFHYALPTFPTAAPIFRAATTFKFTKFFDFAHKYLLETFPDDLDKVDVTVIPHAAAAVTLGRKWNIPDILKHAFYELLRAPPATTPTDDELTPGAPVDERTKCLELADLALLSDAQKHLTAAWMALFLRPDGTTCPGKTPCSATKRSGGWTAIAGKGKVLQRSLQDPICHRLDALMEVKWDETYGSCEKCATAGNASFLSKKAQIWEDISVWFEIPVEKGAEEKHVNIQGEAYVLNNGRSGRSEAAAIRSDRSEAAVIAVREVSGAAMPMQAARTSLTLLNSNPSNGKQQQIRELHAHFGQSNPTN
ncbi:hypothetical protein B0H16DRAFT_1467130 [Mycena metata]|uniref:BTB domain-containing protein n=1 Tax=Mycena metata TaxID=1033252 RepID=A0AAD7MWT3_9AGAR|nr:hypothetical protein B0H16DRAFT_1467130 [Mycena metata]